MMRNEKLLRASNLGVNVAILAVLIFIAASPDGYIRRTLAERRANADLRKSIAEVWSDVTAGVSSEAPVLVEFVDYQCNFCRAMQDTLRGPEEDGRITIVRLHYPIRQIHPRAEAAARAAICAEAQGRFSAMHEYLFATEEWYEASVGWENAIAASGIDDRSRFVECLDSDNTTQRLARDSSIAARWGVRGTPTYVSVGGIRRGVTSLEELLAITRD